MSESLLPAELVELARTVVSSNAALGRRVVIAESCTGGLVAAALTEVPGSSAVLDRAYVTYSNESKQQALGVPADIVDTFGAVSMAVAWAMAKGALERSDADVAVAVTGIAGPEGGSEQKPVGTVIFARAMRDVKPDENSCAQRHFPAGSRAGIRLHAALVALELLLP